MIVHEPTVIASTLWIGRDAVDQAWTLWLVQTRISWQTCFLGFFVERNFSVLICIRVAIHVRGEVLIFTHVVDNDTTDTM